MSDYTPPVMRMPLMTMERAELLTEARNLSRQMEVYRDLLVQASVKRNEIIKTLSESGMSMRLIGRELGISGVRVHEILHKGEKRDERLSDQD